MAATNEITAAAAETMLFAGSTPHIFAGPPEEIPTHVLATDIEGRGFWKRLKTPQKPRPTQWIPVRWEWDDWAKVYRIHAEPDVAKGLRLLRAENCSTREGTALREIYERGVRP